LSESPANPESSLPENARIVFFDGVCGLCNRFIDHVMSRDTEGRLLFAPLQGETFAAVSQRHPELGKTDSMVFLERQEGREKLHLRSDASLAVMRELRGWDGMMARMLAVFPRFLRNAGYRFVALIRYRVFGRRATCRMPTPEERQRFLP